MADRPSYILFITDQQRYDHLGCNGHPVLQTPNIDAHVGGGFRGSIQYVHSTSLAKGVGSLVAARTIAMRDIVGIHVFETGIDLEIRGFYLNVSKMNLSVAVLGVNNAWCNDRELDRFTVTRTLVGNQLVL